MRKQFRICEDCGAALDSGERCDCQTTRREQEFFRAITTLCDADKRYELTKKYGNAIGQTLTVYDAYLYIKK